MDQSPENKRIKLSNDDDISDLNDPSEIKTVDSVASPACDYFGDTELEFLKKELVDFDERDQNNLILLESGSVSEMEGNDPIENNEMVTTDSECSSGVGSNSDARSDFSNESMREMFSKSNLKEDMDNASNQAEFSAKNSEEITSDGILEQGNFVKGNNNGPPRTDNCGSEPKDFPSVLSGEVDGEMNAEENEIKAESAFIGGASSSNDTGDNKSIFERENTLPPFKFTKKIKLRDSNPLEIVVPFVGKRMDWGDIKPCPHRSDLAAKVNKMNFERNGRYVPEMSHHEMMKKRIARSKEEIEREELREEISAIRLATYITKNLEKILLQMQKDEPDEDAIIKYLTRFLKVPVTSLALIHIPQFVHTVMYIRGSPDFSFRVREMAEQCYYKIHVMFPIPAGYNFETVYTSEVTKCLPEGFDGMYDYLLEYDDLDSPSDGEDSAFSDDNQMNN